MDTDVQEPAVLVSVTKECLDCGIDFVLSAGERRFFARKGLTEPKRCVDCRKVKREHPASDR